jgi:hypothetical protein
VTISAGEGYRDVKAMARAKSLINTDRNAIPADPHGGWYAPAAPALTTLRA